MDYLVRRIIIQLEGLKSAVVLENMCRAGVLRATSAVFVFSWLFYNAESLRENAFSNIAKVNLQYGE